MKKEANCTISDYPVELDLDGVKYSCVTVTTSDGETFRGSMTLRQYREMNADEIANFARDNEWMQLHASEQISCLYAIQYIPRENRPSYYVCSSQQETIRAYLIEHWSGHTTENGAFHSNFDGDEADLEVGLIDFGAIGDMVRLKWAWEKDPSKKMV